MASVPAAGANPRCQINLYDESDNLIHTLTDEVLSVHTRSVLGNAGVGSFSFNVPSNIGIISDVHGGWTARVSMDYTGTFTADPLFTGKIMKVHRNVSSDTGYVQLFEGRCLNEVLERRFKKNKRWQNVDANNIVSELAGDLGLGAGEVGANDEEETHTVRTESYLDLLKKISDYWVNAGTQVQCDFYVNDDLDLVWADRPLRDAGVEAFTLDNILKYYPVRDYLPIKNSITVYGAARAPIPNDKDLWTDALDGDGWEWSSNSGDLSLDATSPPAGTNWIRCDTDAPYSFLCDIECVFDKSYTIRDIQNVNFYLTLGLGITNVNVKIYAPDDTNYFQTRAGVISTGSGNVFYTLPLGPENEYLDIEQPDGKWESYGSPNWWDMRGIDFYAQYNSSGAASILVDKLYFFPERWVSTVADAGSIADYGQADAEFTDENLLSNSECEARAQILLTQLSNPVFRLDVVVQGSPNILRGDRCPVTIPDEALSAEEFDVVAVEHDYALGSAWTTKAIMLNTANTRILPPISANESTISQIAKLKEVTGELYKRVLR